MPGAALRGFGRAYMNSGGSAAWQRKEGKSPSGGLNKAGRASGQNRRYPLLYEHCRGVGR